MNVVKKIFAVIFVIFTLSVIFFVLYKMEIISLPWLENQEAVTVHVVKNDDGSMKTTRETTFIPLKGYTKRVLTRTNIGNLSKDTIYMCLKNEYYFPISVPAGMEYEYQFGKSAFNLDGLFDISVHGCTGMDFVGDIANTGREMKSVSQYIIATEENTKGEQVIARYFPNDEICLVAHVYDDNELYTCIYDSITRNDIVVAPSDYNIFSANILDKLEYNGRYIPSIVINDIDGFAEFHQFESGALVLTNRYEDMETTANLFIRKIIMESGSDQIKSMYQSPHVQYYKIGQWHLGLINQNSNTTTVLYGYGDEALSNIMFNLVASNNG